MNRSQYAWSRYGRNPNNGGGGGAGVPGGGNHSYGGSKPYGNGGVGGGGGSSDSSVYDQEDDSVSNVGALGSTWIVAEACKVKDALFLGNVMAVQDSNFLVMNKIAYCIKCQTGFSVPQTLKRQVNYAVINLLGAFLDQELPVQTKDTLLDNFYSIMESAAEQGVGVLLYSFQDLAWCCFSVMAYWVRKYKWTVEHALRIMKSRRPALELPDMALRELESLAARLKAKGLADAEGVRRSSDFTEEEEKILTNTCSNAGLSRGGTNNNPEEFGEEALASPLTRARPLTADSRMRIQWGAGAKLAVFSKEASFESKVPCFSQKPVRGIFRRPRKTVSTGSAGVGNLARFILPPTDPLSALSQAPAAIHGAWASTASAGAAAAAAAASAAASGGGWAGEQGSGTGGSDKSNSKLKSTWQPGGGKRDGRVVLPEESPATTATHRTAMHSSSERDGAAEAARAAARTREEEEAVEEAARTREEEEAVASSKPSRTIPTPNSAAVGFKPGGGGRETGAVACGEAVLDAGGVGGREEGRDSPKPSSGGHLAGREGGGGGGVKEVAKDAWVPSLQVTMTYVIM